MQSVSPREANLVPISDDVAAFSQPSLRANYTPPELALSFFPAGAMPTSRAISNFASVVLRVHWYPCSDEADVDSRVAVDGLVLAAWLTFNLWNYRLRLRLPVAALPEVLRYLPT